MFVRLNLHGVEKNLISSFLKQPRNLIFIGFEVVSSNVILISRKRRLQINPTLKKQKKKNQIYHFLGGPKKVFGKTLKLESSISELRRGPKKLNFSSELPYSIPWCTHNETIPRKITEVFW